jgi:hypothetical protein
MMTNLDERIPLPHVPRELQKLTGKQPPKYRDVYGRVVDGALPAEQSNGRWSTTRGELLKYAKAFGLA